MLICFHRAMDRAAFRFRRRILHIRKQRVNDTPLEFHMPLCKTHVYAFHITSQNRA